MNKVAALTVSILLFSCPTVFGQDAMQYGVKHLTVLAQDQKVRVLRYAPHKGDKTPIHSHPSAVVYVLKGGRVKYTTPDGSTPRWRNQIRTRIMDRTWAPKKLAAAATAP